MEWLKELYGWAGVPYPRLSLAIVAVLGAGLAVASWCFLGWLYAKDHVQTTGQQPPPFRENSPASGAPTPTEKPKESPTATASGNGIAAGGNVSPSASSGGIAVVSTAPVVIGITAEQHEAGLKRREQETRNELTQARPSDKGKLESQLENTQAKLQNPKAALAEYKATLEEARQVLDKLEEEFSPQELAQAYEGLAKGDLSNAEALFRHILAVSGSTVSLVGSREKAFTAALILSQLAEGHGDDQAALRYHKQAMELKPSGDTVQGYGFVGDDTPKVIVALSTIQFSRRTISGIHEATGVNESTIKQKLEWLENNGLAVKSETDSPYWRLTLKGREVFANLE